jgi:hypothetical protein
MATKPQALSAKLKALPTLDLESMASGLRSMRKGQRHLLKLIETEIQNRKAVR